MRRFAAVGLFGLCGLLVSGITVAAQQQGAPWSYDGKNGPLNWGHLDPAYKACSNGKEQSPIEIRGAHLNKNLPAIEFHYLSGPMTPIEYRSYDPGDSAGGELHRGGRNAV